MSKKRRQLSTEIELLEQRSAALASSLSHRIDAIDGQLREQLSPLATVAIGAGAGFLVERLTGGISEGIGSGGRSLGRLGGVLVSLLSSLGSAGAAAAASDAAESAEAGAAAAGVPVQEQVAGAPPL